jgi:hypothetical protein
MTHSDQSAIATEQGPPHYPLKHVRVTLTYDSVKVGETIMAGDELVLERLLERDIVMGELNLDHRLRCGPPFCRGGERPLSVAATRWGIRFERVDARGRRLTR